MKASIIIPSYNACERLHYNLLSLNYQSYDRAEFEVIVIDNASTDDTAVLLREFQANFNLKKLALKTNKGRAHARNFGLKHAEGQIIIFHDSDMIAERDYIQKHMDAHQAPNTVVCGENWTRVYTYFYQNFKGSLKENFVLQHAGIKESELYDKKAVLDKSAVIDGSCFRKSFKLYNFHLAEKLILDHYGENLDGYYFSWSMCVTSNCSIPRKNISVIGGFDENFRSYGCEDLDLGYRLYHNGCRFKKRNDIISIHQEHAIDYLDDGWENIHMFINKYKNLDLLLFYYGYMIHVNKLQSNQIIQSIFIIVDEEERDCFTSLFSRLLLLLRDKHFRYLGFETNIVYEVKTLKSVLDEKKKTINNILQSMNQKNDTKITSQAFETLVKKTFNKSL